MRRLLIIPIVHNDADLGRLESSLANWKLNVFQDEQIRYGKQLVRRFWDELQSVIVRWNLHFPTTVVFQDALPKVAQSNAHLLIQIIGDLSKSGSLNYRLLQWFFDQGAKIVGTENPDLLIEEYKLVKQRFTQNEEHTIDLKTSSAQTTSDQIEQRLKELLVQRDRFIANRIEEELKPAETGILFIGMLHQVENWLPKDIEVEFPIGRPLQIEDRPEVHQPQSLN